MRQVTASVFVMMVLMSGLNSEKILQGLSDQSGRAEHRSEHGGNVFSSDPTGSDPAITGEERKTGPAVRLYPSMAGFRCIKTATSKVAENIRSNAQADYVSIAEQKVLRFEGPDIIHPYYYSW